MIKDQGELQGQQISLKLSLEASKNLYLWGGQIEISEIRDFFREICLKIKNPKITRVFAREIFREICLKKKILSSYGVIFERKKRDIFLKVSKFTREKDSKTLQNLSFLKKSLEVHTRLVRKRKVAASCERVRTTQRY